MDTKTRSEVELKLREDLCSAISALQNLYGLSDAHSVTYTFTARHKEKGIEVLKNHNIQFVCSTLGALDRAPRNQVIVDPNVITFGEFAARKLKQEHKEKV